MVIRQEKNLKRRYLIFKYLFYGDILLFLLCISAMLVLLLSAYDR